MSERQLMKAIRRENDPTPLRPLPQLCGRYKCDHVYVKDESVKNEKKYRYGTFKDRRNAALLQRYHQREEVLFVHITNGNSGYSLGQSAKSFEKETGKKRMVVNIVDRKTPKKVKQMLNDCSIVVEEDLGQEPINDDKLREIARKATGYEGPEDNIIHVETYRLDHGYEEIVQEIKAQLEELGKKPDYIFCPVGGGELATEVAAKAEAVWGEDAPKIIGVTVPQNVLVRGKDFIKKVKSSIADKLACAYSKFKEKVKDLVNSGRMELMTVEEREIAKEYRYLNGIGVNVEPSAAVAFVGAARYILEPSDVVVVINSGKGIYDQKAVDRIWVQKLKRAARYAAVFVMGAGVALGLAKGWNSYYDAKRGKLVAEAVYYAYEEGDNKCFDIEMHERACRFLRRMRYWPPESEDSIRKRCDGKYIWNLPDGQLRFFVKYKKAEAGGTLGYDGGIWLHQMRELKDKYRNGEFDVKITDPSKGLRLIGK